MISISCLSVAAHAYAHQHVHAYALCTYNPRLPHDHLDWPRLSYREQFKEGDEKADRGNDGKTTSKSGLALNGIIIQRKAENREE